MRTHGGKLAVSACLFGCFTTTLPAQQSIHPDIQAADIQRGYHDSAIVVRLVDGVSIHNNFEVVGD